MSQSKKTIRAATHACPHHLDELVALAMLRHFYQERGQEIQIEFLTRTEIPKRSVEFDFLIDIGLEYAPERGRFDHHQSNDPRTHGKSAAGLIFDFLYPIDTYRHQFLRPIIERIDWIDAGDHSPRSANDLSPNSQTTNASITHELTLSAAIKALSGFQPDTVRSEQCLALVEPLVRQWLDDADSQTHIQKIIDDAERVHETVLLLSSDRRFTKSFKRYLVTSTHFSCVGFPESADRFKVLTIKNEDGSPRYKFPASIQGADFVHPRGFLAVFPDRAAAYENLHRLFGK